MTVRHPSLVSVALRPIPQWPHEATKTRRDAQFISPAKYEGGRLVTPGRRVSYEVTLEELKYEVWQLDGSEVLIGVGLGEWDIRKDGAPRAGARAMSHPGVEISFDSRYGRLTYATDVFHEWRDNVRAVAKGLEALRSVERWGVAKRGQQYAGFALLTAGPGLEELGKQLVEKHGSINKALKAVHPDTGTAEDASTHNLQAVMAFREAQER